MTIDRRQLLRSGIAAGAAIVTPGFIWARVQAGEIGDATNRQRAMLKIVADFVIPQTDTASASQVGVPAFVELALKHRLDGTGEAAANAAIQGAAQTKPRAGGGTYLLHDLETALDKAAGGDFTAAPAASQRDVLTRYDASAFAAGGEKDPWHKIKDLILIGYYNSEIGASKELQYELVPGRWDPDLPLAADNRSWSSDWTARDFG